MVYKSPKEASIKKEETSYKGAAIITEGEHDNIHRYDWKNFKKPAEEEPALVYCYSSTNADYPRKNAAGR